MGKVVALTGMILILTSGVWHRNGQEAAKAWEGPPLWAEPEVSAYIKGLKRLTDREKYVFAVANTLQVLVSLYAWSEGRIPTREEFLPSPYNLLLPEAWTNPYTNEAISWSDTPSAGKLAYRMPQQQTDYLLIVPWVSRFGGLAFEKDRESARKANTLGIFGAYPGPMVLWPTPEDVDRIRRNCTERYSPLTHFCWKRRKEFEANGFSGADWSAYVLAEAISLTLNRAYQVAGEGMPRTLREMQEQYWWLYNTRLRNPFSAGPVRETPFLQPSAGDVTLGFYIWRNDLLAEPMAYGENARPLPPYHYAGESAGAMWANLARMHYVGGLEGKSLCALWRDSNPVGGSRTRYEALCPEQDRVFLSSVPRYAQGELPYLTVRDAGGAAGT
jgi:hypothetical protein